jgi:hypothetical protein
MRIFAVEHLEIPVAKIINSKAFEDAQIVGTHAEIEKQKVLMVQWRERVLAKAHDVITLAFAVRSDHCSNIATRTAYVGIKCVSTAVYPGNDLRPRPLRTTATDVSDAFVRNIARHFVDTRTADYAALNHTIAIINPTSESDSGYRYGSISD